MKYRILKIAALLLLLTHLSSCIFHRGYMYKGKPTHHHYRRAGRAW